MQRITREKEFFGGNTYYYKQFERRWIEVQSFKDIGPVVLDEKNDKFIKKIVMKILKISKGIWREHKYYLLSSTAQAIAAAKTQFVIKEQKIRLQGEGHGRVQDFLIALGQASG